MAAITIRVADIKGISYVEPYPFIAPSDAISQMDSLMYSQAMPNFSFYEGSIKTPMLL